MWAGVLAVLTAPTPPAWARAPEAETSGPDEGCAALRRLNPAQGRWAGKFDQIAQDCPVAPARSEGPLAVAAPNPPEHLVSPQGAPAEDSAPLIPVLAERLPAAGLPATGASAPASLRPPTRAVHLAPLIDAVALRYDIDPLLMHAMARVESAHRWDAVSPAGAVGLMQVLPATAARFGLPGGRALAQPQVNLNASARYLKWLQRRFRNDLRLVIAAYNAGEGAVERHGGQVPPYAETQAYVRRVLTEYEHLRATAERLRRGEAGTPRGLM